MVLTVYKSLRLLILREGNQERFRCPVNLGRCPVGSKTREGDDRTPEGRYFICLVKEQGKYGRSLGISYPNLQDGERALNEGRINEATLAAIRSAQAERRRPPWGSPLGGEIYLHEQPVDAPPDWTRGCIAVNPQDMDSIFPLRDRITEILIEP